MSANMHTITIPNNQEDFLEENPDLSLSKIAQAALDEIMVNRRISNEIVRELNRKLENWQTLCNKQRAFMTRKGVLDEYLEEDGL
jgi:hypothetical protein